MARGCMSLDRSGAVTETTFHRDKGITMLKFGKMATIAGFAFLLASLVTPASAGTPDEAKALAEKAAVVVAAEGEKSFPKIGDPKGEFVQGDLYVSVADLKGNVLAAPNPKLVGLNLWELTDPDGIKVVQEMVKIVQTTGSGWITYKFTNPVSKKIESKKAWVQK